MLRRVALVRTDVSEKLSASIIRVARIGELRTTLAVTSNRRTLRRNTVLTLIFLIILCEEYNSWSSSLCSFLHPPDTSALFGQNILLSILFSNTLSLCSSLNVRDQVSHPYRTTGKIIVLYIVIVTFSDNRQGRKGSGPNMYQAYLTVLFTTSQSHPVEW
jgi:hypothetical protein